MKIIKYIFIKIIKIYQLIISPVIGPNCRFYPSCSNYMIESIKEWGSLKGLFLGVKRITRCHPFGKSGNDPVPKKEDMNSRL
tara:strand:+ start:715 stop:960 length:246 start_codon:yes stop_codon:yes gene_type:complete